MNTPKPCPCGHTPSFLTCHDGPEPILQLVSKCGRHKGAVIRYRTDAQRALAEQAAIDGWNLAD
jgi:hypothetical protein